MANAIPAKLRFGPDSRRVSEAVDGGLLVMADAATGLVKKTTGPTVAYLGVNLHPVVPAGFDHNEVGPFGDTIHAIDAYPNDAAIAWTGTYKLTFATDAGDGVLLYPAADGKVSTVATGALRPIGLCVQPGGVVVATNPVGLVRLI